MGVEGSISSSSSVSRIKGTSMMLRRLRQLASPAAGFTQLVVMPTAAVTVDLTVTVAVLVFGVTKKRNGPVASVLPLSSDCPKANRTDAKRTEQTRTFIVIDVLCVLALGAIQLYIRVDNDARNCLLILKYA